MNSYQKLKQKNEKLREDIYNIIMNPHDKETISLIMVYKLQFSVDFEIARGAQSKTVGIKNIID